MNRHALVSVAIALALAGCSSAESRRIANGDFNYTTLNQQQKLKVPENLDAPAFSRDYELPELGENAPKDLVGDKLDISSPSLVLATVNGTHVEEGRRDAVVLFDKIDDSKPLDTQIWDNLIAYLDKNNIAIDAFDKESNQLTTDWIRVDQQSGFGWLSVNEENRSLGQRFTFSIDMKPHGRSATLKVTLEDYMETLNGNVIATAKDVDPRRLEVNMLNQVIGHYENQLLIEDARRVARIREGLSSELGFDAKGEPAMLINADYQTTWPRLLLVFRTLGFNVTDLDQSSGIIYADYNGQDEGWWDSWFGGDDGLKLDQKTYHVSVGDLGQQTSITFMNEENDVFTPEQLKALFAPFSATMADDDLDL